ncbi:hypothetical protein [Aeromicrobium sp.]|uniref:hypothetical protein n=1 Tax=Aeromicrobium sp. TaxID=1871063 RepID=UPI0030C554B6
MRPPRPVPARLAARAFSRDEARSAGITPRMLQHQRFVEIHPSVYRLDDVGLDDSGRLRAAQLAMPADARVSHASRLRMLGLERGDLTPFHFTVGRDLHLDIPGITLHRTVLMPAHDGVAVSVEAAYVGYAATARTIDLIAVGDWLLNRGHLTVGSLVYFIHAQPWRPGAGQAATVLRHLDGRARSLPESETRAALVFAGLPKPEVNRDVRADDGRFLGCGDLVYLLFKLIVEYEGGQHWTSAVQIVSDVDRYAGLRRAEWEYVQVTKRHLRSPKSMVRAVHRALAARGYNGPAPAFGPRWDSLFGQPIPAPTWRTRVGSQPQMPL